MQVIENNAFKKAKKKLHKNEYRDLELAVADIIRNPTIGQRKKGNLSHLYVHKFKMVGQLMLLAHTWESDVLTLTLLGLGSHENFYRDLKR